jgi:hypothetical protein
MEFLWIQKMNGGIDLKLGSTDLPFKAKKAIK